MKIQIPNSFTICVLIGAALGAAFGDYFFPSVEVALGEPLDDILFMIGGSFLGGVLHEIIASVSGRS